MATKVAFFNELLERVLHIGSSLHKERQPQEEDLAQLCERLLADSGEATGLAIAQQILDRSLALDRSQRDEFFMLLLTDFGCDESAMQAVMQKWQNSEPGAARKMHLASEPRSMELFRRINRVPGGTSGLVQLRAKLLETIRRKPELKLLDDDLRHLLASWFNRGFLELRRISWSTSAEILEKIIQYEAVHEIHGFEDLRQRVAAEDRRLYAYFHPSLPTEPLIFLEVALMDSIPSAIGPILDASRKPLEPSATNTAVFYSISNCQQGLHRISFGNLLIKQVVMELQREFPHLDQFVTLSPVPGFRQWATSNIRSPGDNVPEKVVGLLRDQMQRDIPDDGELSKLLAFYLAKEKRASNGATDPVAHFHLGNGASLHRINTKADNSKHAQDSAWGFMVNYLYTGADIERNHEDYVNAGQVALGEQVEVILAATVS
ncbi:MAG: malonyl-CoA decarboxylase [Parasphingorhabdus sp.]|jgi:malonyl-CoA decarboxylase